jgi:hypothetical protein
MITIAIAFPFTVAAIAGLHGAHGKTSINPSGFSHAGLKQYYLHEQKNLLHCCQGEEIVSARMYIHTIGRY